MSVAVWPESLPQVPEIAGYSEGLGKQVIRTDMDAGPAKVRRRTTANVRPLSVQYTLTTAQLDIFIAFWTDDCQGGALPFQMRDPRDANGTILVRFAEDVAWTALAANDGAGGKMYRLPLTLEIVP